MSIRPLIYVLALASSTPAMATTFISGNVSVGTSVTLGSHTSTNTKNASLVASPGTTGANISSFVNDSPSNANAFAGVSGKWTSADAGSVKLGWGWNARSFESTSISTNTVGPDWSYSFTASGNGTFNISGTITGAGDTFGLDPVLLGGSASGSFGGSAASPAATNSFSVPLLAGHTYTFTLAEYGNISNGSGLIATGHATGNFDWSIKYNAVPEASSWALLLLGIGAAGTVLRRREKAQPRFA